MTSPKYNLIVRRVSRRFSEPKDPNINTIFESTAFPNIHAVALIVSDIEPSIGDWIVCLRTTYAPGASGREGNIIQLITEEQVKDHRENSKSWRKVEILPKDMPKDIIHQIQIGYLRSGDEVVIKHVEVTYLVKHFMSILNSTIIKSEISDPIIQ